MTPDFKNISPYKERLELFEDSDIVSRIDKAKASVLSPKAKDCQRQLNEASSVWAIDGTRFLIVFSNEKNTEGRQKATIWGRKAPGEYQRIKTVWTSCNDYIFEAVALFLMEYFEVFILSATYTSDTRMLQDIQTKLKEAMRYTPSNLKQKVKLLKAWDDIMPRFNSVMAQIDERIARSKPVPARQTKSKGQMKTFLQDKGATYNYGDSFTVAVRKDCIEYYVKLKKGHAVANIEIFNDAVRISIACRDFADQLFDKPIREGISLQTYPKLIELIDSECKYTILTDRTGATAQTRIFLDIEKTFSDWIEALADKEVRKEITDMIEFFLALYNELVKAPSPTFKTLARNFYD